MDYENLLNKEQLLPVMDTEGAVLVLAGAGSGKTRVLTHRIAYLIEKKQVSPYNILAITFTNKAANEMKERVKVLTGQGGVLISTFHSFCARVLREDIKSLGYNDNFSIYDDSDSNHIIGRILKNIDIEDNKDLKKTIRWHISNAKNHGLEPKEYAKRIADESNHQIISMVYTEYENELKRNNALDFDDLLLKTILLFSKDKQVLAKYQERFHYIHIDEFQDTNKIQYMLIRLLAMKHGNIFVVGDDDQSIYGWRWAEVANISHFKQNFAGCRVYKLEQNYRSTANILNLANTIIANNNDRMDKTLWTAGDKGVNIIYNSSYNDRAEADYVLGQIDSLIRHNDYEYKDFAILVRASSLTKSFEEKLVLYNFPYRIIGGNKFFDRMEVKDFLAYLKLIANAQDRESVLRVINVPKRGIGDGAIDKLTEACDLRGMSLLEGIIALDSLELPTAVSRNIRKFREVVIGLLEIKELPLIDFIDTAKAIINFESMYDEKLNEDSARLANIDAFVTTVKEFCADNEDAKLDEFLQSVSLMTDTEKVDEANCVTVATIHGVKGLEFRCVFIVGLEEGIFPSVRKESSDADMQEERRIMYVAVTRARERLYLTNAQSRYRYGNVEQGKASRFLQEGGLVCKPLTSYGEEDFPVKNRPSFDFASMAKKTSYFANNDAEKPKIQSKDLSIFKNNMRVEHSRFGVGTIIEITGENAKIEFEKLGVKIFNLRLAPITICE